MDLYEKREPRKLSDNVEVYDIKLSNLVEAYEISRDTDGKYTIIFDKTNGSVATFFYYKA